MSRIDLAGMLSDARARVDAEAPVGERDLPRFARLERKDARIRVDQDAALTALARALMRRRTVKAERITANTLIRVAIDLLLHHSDTLRGSTETELLHSVTSALPHSGTSAVPHSGSSEPPLSGIPAIAEFATAPIPDSSGPVSRSAPTMLRERSDRA